MPKRALHLNDVRTLFKRVWNTKKCVCRHAVAICYKWCVKHRVGVRTVLLDIPDTDPDIDQKHILLEVLADDSGNLCGGMHPEARWHAIDTARNYGGRYTVQSYAYRKRGPLLPRRSIHWYRHRNRHRRLISLLDASSKRGYLNAWVKEAKQLGWRG